MANFEILRENLAQRGFTSSYFETAQEAAEYLDRQIDGRTVAFGGSCTLQEMGLYQKLSAHNHVVWHWEGGSLAEAANTDVYLSSVNGLAETGEIVNIDGNCNRVASTMFGHKTVYLVVGVNKIAPDYDAALWRARNIAAPKNAQRLKKNTPCAVKGDRCYDCKSPERICKALTVLWGKPSGLPQLEIVLVNQALGY